MNATIVHIPDAVEISIANREFAVAEGAYSDQPAIIGRVLGIGEDTWSVIAIVTRGRDEKGRSASMYRYFLTQGSEGYQNLRLILAWWESQEIPLTFNPFDLREMGKPNLCNVDETSTQFRKPSPEAIAIPVNTFEPILLTPQQQYDLQTLNTLAFKKYNANKNGQAISWAFNVEALEKPERFLVIQAASTKAYQILQKAITNTPKVLAPVLTDEEALKSAIRGLMNSSQVKPENVKVIADALANNQITSEYWHTLFDGQGAKTAISQRIYSPQMTRLITLRAMVIPDTMLEFLGWLNIKPGQKPDENQTVSLEFQKSIRPGLPKDKLANSIKFILPEVLKKTSIITPEAIGWLLRSNDSVWASARKEFTDDILYDLQLMVKNFRDKTVTPSNSYKCDPQTWKNFNNNIRSIYSSNSFNYKIEEYNSFAKLFEYLKDYTLAAYFYQVSEGIVPKEIFEEISHGHSSYIDVLGLRLEREVTFIEGVINFLFQEVIVPIQVVIILSISLSILSFTGGILVERKLNSSNNGNSGSEQIEQESNNSRFGNKPKVNSNNNSTRPGSNTTSIGSGNSSQYSRPKASLEFNTTQNALEQIIKNIINQEQKKSNSISREQIIKAIQVVLQVENVNYDKLKPSGGTETNVFVDAVYNYQKNNNILGSNNWDGIITAKGQTAKNLEEDVKKELDLSSSRKFSF
jgi:hypothetical protein